MFFTTKWLQQNKVAVCLYLYHTDLWDEFRTLLLPIKDHIKLYIGLCEENPIVSDLDLFDHHITWHKNYGVDVAPFLQQIPLIKEPIFIKIHSKKSKWGFKQHINWRYIILHDLIGSLKLFKRNIKTLLDKEDNGILCNPRLLIGNREFHNTKKIQEVCKIIGMNYQKVGSSKFVIGNMFMGKTSFFQSIFNNHINEIDILLKEEKGKVSDQYFGTYSHSMEQIFGYVCKNYDLKFCFPKQDIIKILNNKAQNKKYFSLIKTYKDYCYLMDDPNVYGFYEEENDKTCKITWYHLDNIVIQKYNIINHNTIIKQDLCHLQN